MKAFTGSLLLPVAFAIGLTACERRDAPIEPSSTVPPNTAAPTAQSPARPPNDVSDPGKDPSVEVTEPKGTETLSSGEQTEKKE